MPTYGIVDQTTPSGQVPISQNGGQFRQAADAATALSDFVNSFTPPKTPADWLAFDTGWASPQQPSMGKRWAYDFDSPALVEVDAADIIQVCAVLNFDDGTDWSITQDGSWQTLRRFVLDPQAICGDLNRFVVRPRFAYQSDAGSPQLRITMNGALFGQPRQLPDNPGWSRNAWGPRGAVGTGMATFAIEGDRNGATLFELRALTIELGKRLD